MFVKVVSKVVVIYKLVLSNIMLIIKDKQAFTSQLINNKQLKTFKEKAKVK